MRASRFNQAMVAATQEFPMPRGRPRGADDSNLPIGPMSENQFRAFLREIDKLQAKVEDAAEEVKTARSALSAKWKEFKKQGGKSDAMRECMALRKMEEGDLIQHEEDRRRYAAWMRLPIGAQPDMFAADESGADTEDAHETEGDAEDEPTHAPEPVIAAPMTARAKRGQKGPKLVETPNTTNSPLN
jgi:uncharacterized protein (UPF0335 family)